MSKDEPRTVAMPERRMVALSVVIVSWNTRDLLERCLRSVIDDTERSRIATEIIVVDNASTDGTISALQDRFTDVTFVPLDRNIGFAAATNAGIKRTTAHNILLLNPDTVLQAGAIVALFKALYSMSHVGMVSGLLLNSDGSLQSGGYRFPGLIQSFLDFFPIHPRLVSSRINGRVSPGDNVAPYVVDHPLGACMMVRRAVIDRVGLLDEQYFMYSEEIDWCRRIKEAGWLILVVPEARIVHYGGQSTSQMKGEMFLELHRSRARYFRRYETPRFLRSVGWMARVARRWAEVRSRMRLATSEGDLEQVNALRSVEQIYGPARGHHD